MRYVICWLLLVSVSFAEYRLLHFEAAWCTRCPVLRNRIDAMEFQAWAVENGVKVMHIDMDEHEKAAAAYKVTSVPTCILVYVDQNKNARVIRRKNGVLTQEQLLELCTPPATPPAQ